MRTWCEAVRKGDDWFTLQGSVSLATEEFLCGIDGKTNADWKYRGTQLKAIVRQKADVAGL